MTRWLGRTYKVPFPCDWNVRPGAFAPGGPLWLRGVIFVIVNRKGCVGGGVARRMSHVYAKMFVCVRCPTSARYALCVLFADVVTLRDTIYLKVDLLESDDVNLRV